MTITDDTVCVHCRRPASDHCDEHWLRCCPGHCPGDSALNHRFTAPQPPRPPTKDRHE